MYMCVYTTATVTHKTHTTHTQAHGEGYIILLIINIFILIEFVLFFSLYFWVDSPITLKRKINTPPLIDLIKFL